MYFARMYETTGIYIIMFKVFLDQTQTYIILLIVFMLLGSEFFRVIGGLNMKIDTSQVPPALFPAKFPTWLEAIKYSF